MIEQKSQNEKLMIRLASILCIIVFAAIAHLIGQLAVFFAVLLAMLANEALGYAVRGRLEQDETVKKSLDLLP